MSTEPNMEQPRATERQPIIGSLHDPNASLSTTVNDFLQAFEQSEKVRWGTGGGGNEGAQYLVDTFFTLLGEERRDGSKMQEVHLSLLAVLRQGRPVIVGRLFEGIEAEVQRQQREWIASEQQK